MSENVLIQLGLNCSREICENLTRDQEQALKNIFEMYLNGQITFEEGVKQIAPILHSSGPLEKLKTVLSVGDTPLPPHVDNENEQNRRKKTRTWSAEEDHRLIMAIYKYGDNWNAITEFVGNSRSRSQCSQRWIRVLDPGIDKGPWTDEENEKLLQLVEKYGTKGWVKVASEMTSRSDVQCRYHYSQLTGKNVQNTEKAGELPAMIPAKHDDQEMAFLNLLTPAGSGAHQIAQPPIFLPPQLQKHQPVIQTNQQPVQTIFQPMTAPGAPTMHAPPKKQHQMQHLQQQMDQTQSQSKLSNQELTNLANTLKHMSPTELNQVLSQANISPNPQPQYPTNSPYFINGPTATSSTLANIQMSPAKPTITQQPIKLTTPTAPTVTFPPIQVVSQAATAHQSAINGQPGDGKNVGIEPPLLLKNSSDFFRSNQLFDSSFWNI